MKIKHLKTTQTLSLIAAGKLAVNVNAVEDPNLPPPGTDPILTTTDTGTTGSSGLNFGGGKLDDLTGLEDGTKPKPLLHLDQIGMPLDIVIPPMDDYRSDFEDFGTMPADSSMDPTMDSSMDPTMDPSMAEDYYDTKPQYWDKDGIIFTDDIKEIVDQGKRPRINFVVSGVPNQGPMTVLLMYSTTAGSGDFWGAAGFNMGAGQLQIGTDLQILAGVNVQPVVPFLPAAETNLGKVELNHQVVTLPVSMKQLQELTAPDGTLAREVFFQAIAFPSALMEQGLTEAFAQGQASELDRFVISRPAADGQGGSKAEDSGKMAEGSTNTDTSTTTDGSKTADGSKNSGSTDTSTSTDTNTNTTTSGSK